MYLLRLLAYIAGLPVKLSTFGKETRVAPLPF